MGANKTNLSILGMYDYTPDIFDELQLPEQIDKDDVIDNILLECSELEALYPNPVFMKKAIGRWSAKELPIWKKLYESTQFEYNPIWNKDGSITETETQNLHEAGDNSAETSSSSSTEQEQTQKVAAYNSDDFENREQNNNDVSIDDSVESSGNYTKDNTGTVTRTRIETGNIGITTTQQMIKEEREVVQFNVIDYIINSFKNRFCILVY